MKIIDNLTFKQNHFFYFVIILLLFILIKTEQYQNKIILKTKGSIICKNYLETNCFKKNDKIKIFLNGSEYIDNTNDSEYDINYFEFVWSETITNFSYMFYGFDNILEVDLSKLSDAFFDGTKRMEYMFSNCNSLISINLFQLNIQSRTTIIQIYLNNMFSNCNSLISVSLFPVNIQSEANVLFYLNDMFSNCSSLTSMKMLPIRFRSTGEYTNSLINMDNMFSNCNSLAYVNISVIKAISYHYASIYMNNMFSHCVSLSSADISNIYSSSDSACIYMNNMFSNCSSLISVKLSNINTIGSPFSYLYMNDMFNGCISLSSIPIFKANSNRNNCFLYMNNIFKNCFSLNSIDLSEVYLSGGNTQKELYIYGIFSGCITLSYIKLFNFEPKKIGIDQTDFDYIPNNIIYCTNFKENQLFEILSKKTCSLLNCTYKWKDNSKNKIIFTNNTCVDDCGKYSLFDVNNICYDSCPKGSYKKNYICYDCYISCEICNQSGTNEIHNCISCKKGYNIIFYKSNDKLNCYENDKDKKNIYNIYEKEYSLGNELISNLLFCYNNCFKNKYSNDCYHNCKNNKYYLNKDCLLEISFNSFNLNKYNYSCNFNNNIYNIYLLNDESLINKEKIFCFIFNKLQNMINSESDFNDNNLLIIEEQEQTFKYIITSNKNNRYINEFNNSIIFNFQNKIIEKYNILNDDDLFLLIITKTYNQTFHIITKYEIHYFFDKLKIEDISKFELKEEKKCYFILTTNNECVNFCKIQDRINKKCINRYNDTYKINETQNWLLLGIKEEIISENFNITNVETGNDIILEEIDLKIIITSVNNQVNNLENKNITNIHLRQCENELRDKYKIKGDIYILKIEKEIEGLKIPKIEYEAYAFYNSNKLEQLDLNICKGNKIDIYLPVDLSNKNVDTFNIKSEFYDNICYTYTTDEGLDITLSDRKNVFIDNNMTLCEENCDFERYDFKKEKAICSCLVKIKMPLISEISFDKEKLINKMKDIKSLVNISIIKCYYLLLKIKTLIKNIGFLTVFPIIIFYIISIFIFFCKDIKNINRIINNIVNAKINIKKDKNKKITQNNPPLRKTIKINNNKNF